MIYIFYVDDKSIYDISDVHEPIAVISIGHTVQIKEDVFEVVGVRHDLDAGSTRVDLDPSGRATRPPVPDND
jgi:hypothetical protein